MHSRTHIPTHNAQNSLCTASGFWQGTSAIMKVSFLFCFHDFGWESGERCAVLLTGDKSTVNETLA